MKNRLLSALLALCLILSLMPEAWAADQSCGPDVTWSFNATTNGLLQIRGSGSMYDYNNTDVLVPWHGSAANIRAVVVDAAVTSFGNYAFDGCTNLTDIYYLGTAEEWKAFTTGEGNAVISGCRIHYENEPCLISYDPSVNSASGKMDVSIVEKNRPFELPECNFTLTGRRFRGWRIDNSTEFYPVGYQYTPEKDSTLTAFWEDEKLEEKSYDVQFLDADEITDTYSFNYSDTPQALLLPAPFRDGFDFLGWTYEIDGVKQDTPTLGPVIVPAKHQGNLQLTAKWRGLPYSVRIIGNGHGEPVEVGRMNYSASTRSQTATVTITAEPGYRLLSIAGVSGVSATVLSDRAIRVTIDKNTSGDKTLKAKWEAITYRIICDPNGGDLIGANWAEYTVEDTGPGGAIGPLPSARRHGYTHTGWTLNGVDLEEVTPGDHDFIILPEGTTGDLTLYAKWEPETYTITYDSTEGTGTMPEDEATYGEPFTLPANGFTAPAGKQFGGWHIPNGAFDKDYHPIMVSDENGNSTIKKDFDPNDEIYLEEDTTIQAIWKQIYTIKFNPGSQDASGTMQDVSRVEGDKYQLPACGFTSPDGKVFKSWMIGSEEYIPYAPDAPEDAKNTYTLPAYTNGSSTDITIVAVWENLYTITYKPGAGTGADVTDKITQTDGVAYKLPGVEDFHFTPPEGKHFAGWTITAEGKDPEELAAGENYAVESDIIVTARWDALTYTVKFDPGEGTGTMADITGLVFEQKVKLPECGFTPPAGMQFKAWEFERTELFPGESITIRDTSEDRVLTVKALWKKIGYSIEFVNGTDEEGNAVVVRTIDGKYEDTVTLLEGVPESEQTLKAWRIGGMLYAPGNTFKMETFAGAAAAPSYKITAEAVWPGEGEEPLTITYASGYSDNEAADTVQVFAGVTFGLPASCTFAEPPSVDMTFAGWSKNGIGGEKFAQDTDITAEGITFTALWEGRIVYELNGGTIGESAPRSYIYKEVGQDLDGRVTDPVRPGYVFDKEKGWELSDESVRLVSQEIKLPAGFKGTLTLTAKWGDDQNVYRVTFDPNGGTGTMEPNPDVVSKKEEGDTTYSLPENKFTPPVGMEFDYWSLNGERATNPVILTGHITLKAEWKKKDVDPDAKDCVVTYVPGEGTGEAVVEEGHKVGEWLKLPECAFTAPEGKEFDAWDKGAPGEEFLLEDEAVTITALWKDKEPEPEDPNKPWTITFDAGGGTGTMSSVTVPKAEGGATYTLPACSFTAPEGKTFQAWQFDGQEYAPGAVITITGDTTITAVWKDAEVKPPKPTSWKITYNLNGGYMTGSGPTSYNLSDQAQTLNVPVPYKSGYTFLGWTYSGVSKPTKSVIIRANMTGDLTVVANWQMNPGAGGSNNTSQGYYISVSATAGGEIIIPWEYASQGATVSVQARPQPGYEVGSVTVVNSQGFEVGDLRDLGGGNYSFTMPGYRVNVSATFKLQSAAAGPISRPVMNYEDVRLGDWYYDSVEYVYNRGMMSGVSATQFGPNGQATRGAIWTALAAHAGFDINGGATWYERGQYWAVNRGITDGESPSGNITREQLVTMLWRYKGSPAVFGGDLWQFSDGYAVSPYAMDAMRWAVSTGLMGGANGRLNPQASTTRAEAATILARFCQS